jgi:hypothetical protein
MEEGDDVILSCRVIGGKYWSIITIHDIIGIIFQPTELLSTHSELSNFITPLNQILPYGKVLCVCAKHIVFAHLLIYAHFKFSPHVSTFFHFMRVNLSCYKLFKLLPTAACCFRE